MRILAVNYEYPPLGGGGGRAHRDLLEALAERHSVTVLTTHQRGLPRTEVMRGVRIIRLPVVGRTARATATVRSMISFAPAALAAGVLIVGRQKPDVIHAFFAVPSGLPAVLLGKIFGLPVAVTIVGADVYDPSPTAGLAVQNEAWLRATVRFVIRGAARCTAISEDSRARAVALGGIGRAVEVIPLGFAPPPFTLPPPSREEGFCCVTVGRLIPRKGLDDLLRAFAECRVTGLRLEIVGEGPLAEPLARLVQRFGLQTRVRIHGAVSEEAKWKILRDAHCFVSASYHEGFGIAFLEAMYAGLPIVATDVGGHRDFLKAEEHALLVPRRNPEALSAAVTRLAADESLRRRLSERNRADVQPFAVTRVAGRYEALFAEVTAQKVARGGL